MHQSNPDWGTQIGYQSKMTTSIASFSSIPISPLSLTRSKRTAEIIWSARKEEIITDSDLREIDLYSFQGHLKQKGKAKFGATFQQWQTDAANFNIDGHYPVRELWDRARSCWTKILTHESMFVLVVAHNAVNQALVATAIGLGTEYFRILLQSNCGVTVLDFTPRLETPNSPIAAGSSGGRKTKHVENEYKRGISGWNFNLEDVKAQASLIQDEDIISEKDLGGSSVSSSGLDHEKELQHQLSSEDNDLMQNKPSSLSADVTLTNALTKFEKSDDDASIAGSNHEHQVSQNSASCFEDNVKIICLENLAQMSVEETLTARLCKVIRGGEVHQAISFFQMVVFSQAKERGTRQAFTPEQINEACYVDINSNKAVFDSLRNNPKVNYDGRCFAYKSKHALKDKNQLLILIRKFPEGIAVIDLKDAYPTVMEDLQALKAAGQIWLLSNFDSQEDIAYPNDPRVPIKVDDDLKLLFRGIELPRDMIDIEKDLQKNGMKPATNTAKI
ncbi:unnamed protein product [Camellia sinensis]